MLLQPRTYRLWQAPDRDQARTSSSSFSFFQQTSRFHESKEDERIARKMLLVHQAGAVKIGEVVRYTLTYTPSNDRILPTPSHLQLKIKNTSAIPLRAAWVHGPYALHVSAYPATFSPHRKSEDPNHGGVPEYEPMLKAGGSWQAKLSVPDEIRETGADLGKRRQSVQLANTTDADSTGSVTWIVEVASQILFSSSASVHFEVLVGRDKRSLDLGFAAVAGHGHGGPGQVQYQATEKERKRARRNGNVQTGGVYSKAARLVVENTEVLWDKPPLPSWDDNEPSDRKSVDSKRQSEDGTRQSKRPKKRRKIHLVVVTHGLHSNIGADMLFLKESIDATVKQARHDAKKRKENDRAKRQDQQSAGASDHTGERKHSEDETENETSTAPLSGGQEELNNAADESDDEEETIVRGFSGNAVRTENGIQYLGKRLAKYVLRFTYPDQPFLPVKKPLSQTLTDTFKSESVKAKRDGMPSHAGSSIHHPGSSEKADELPYTFTSISFVGHSLGGLIQTYAVAYIYKHSPTFFNQIKPVNFICMASPMLGLSNENPMYVKFALDFGLVGRTGQDLGLTWRPPTLARGGWNAMIGGLGAGQKDQKQKQEDPSAKPLLRILPTGPAHRVLRMFRNRTVYSNVVNDGIVPLRTSCLLFLDWRGLGKVDKARRENGLIGTVAEWGWAELTGQNSSAVPERVPPNAPDAATSNDEDDEDEHVRRGEGETVPQPDEDETVEDSRRLTTRPSWDEESSPPQSRKSLSQPNKARQQERGMWDNFMDIFRSTIPADRSKSPNNSIQSAKRSSKSSKAVRRGQIIYHEEDEMPEDVARGRSGTTSNPTMRPHMPHMHTGQTGQTHQKRPQATRGDSIVNLETGEFQPPPQTSIFESAGDVLHPPLPGRQWITDPSSRARTIFHDRVYHPEDIPPPPGKRHRSSLIRTFSSDSTYKSNQSPKSSNLSASSHDSTESGGMKVEEKIARAYHRDLSWRKVLVRLEPDAHNNMIVRRMFANAYGWPVIKHLCDTHFGNTHAALTRNEDEPARDRARAIDEPIPETGEEVAEQTDRDVPERTQSEIRESRDELTDLTVPRDGASSSYSSTMVPQQSSRPDSGSWDDAYFDGSDEDDSDMDERNFVAKMINPMPPKKPEQVYQRPTSSKSNGAPKTPITPYTDGHRGLAPISPTSPKTLGSVNSPSSTKSTFNSANVDEPVVAKRFVEEPESLGSTAEMGLRKSVEEQVSPTKTKGKGRPSSSGGITEAVSSSQASKH